MTDYLNELFAGYGPILSVSDLTKILGVNSKTVYDYLQSGDLPAYRIGTKWLILRDEVREALRTSSNRTRSLRM